MFQALNHAMIYTAILVGIFRLAEIFLGEINAKNMLQQGGKEFAPRQRLPILLIYTAWLLTLVLITPLYTKPIMALFILFALLQMLRWWCMAHLKQFWTTRIIIVPHAELITSGPYRFLPHPIYIVLFCEVPVLSFAFQQWAAGCFFGGLVGLWLVMRIQAENNALNSFNR